MRVLYQLRRFGRNIVRIKAPIFRQQDYPCHMPRHREDRKAEANPHPKFSHLIPSHLIPSRLVSSRPISFPFQIYEMDDATDFFETRFRSRLESQLLGIQGTLTSQQLNRVNSWIELLTETEESLKSRSKQRQSVRRRALYFAQTVLAIGRELFVLCSLSYSISSLGSIPPGPFYDQLERWWRSKESPRSLCKATDAIRQSLPRNENAHHYPPTNSSLQTQPEERISQPLVAQSPHHQAPLLNTQHGSLVGEGK